MKKIDINEDRSWLISDPDLNGYVHVQRILEDGNLLFFLREEELFKLGTELLKSYWSVKHGRENQRERAQS